MAVSVGRVRGDATFDLKLEALVHNTIRGAAGAAILNAELLKARDEGSPFLQFAAVDPAFVALRRDPLFTSIVASQ
jgi:hypothetical protein